MYEAEVTKTLLLNEVPSLWQQLSKLEKVEEATSTSEKNTQSLLDFARPKDAIFKQVKIKQLLLETLSRLSIPKNKETMMFRERNICNAR